MFVTDTVFDFKKELDNARYCVNKQQTKDFVITEVTFGAQNNATVANFREGNYTTIGFRRPEIDMNCLKLIVKFKISRYIASAKTAKVLVVGLGNENLTADSFGSIVSGKIDVNPDKKNTHRKIYAVSPSVKGITGLDSDVILNMFNQIIDPDIIIMADALMTREAGHLANLVQISDKPFDFSIDNGLPKRNLIRRLPASLPVIAIGFPTTIRLNAIRKNVSEDIIFTSANIDLSVNAVASTVAQAINEVLSS
jgi:spore protease